MSGALSSEDLIVLVADLDTEQAVRGLLSRPHRIRIKSLSFEVRRHPNRDAGCRTQAAAYLRPFFARYRRALVVFDLHGSGSRASREDTQRAVEYQLRTNGWGERSKAIVIEPELEAWVWTRSPHVSQAVGWESRYDQLRARLESQGLWPADLPKPPDPKRAMQRAMAQAVYGQPTHRRRRARRRTDPGPLVPRLLAAGAGADLRFHVRVELAGELSREDRASVDELLAEVSEDLKSELAPPDRNG